MKPLVPHLVKIPKRTVLTITAVGSPKVVFTNTMPSLYGTAYGTMFKVYKPQGKKMAVGHLVSAYPDAHRKPKTKWTITSDLEVSDFVTAKALIQKNSKLPVKLAKRPAATYAQILHVGTYASENPTITLLHKYMKEEKLTIVGPHEEVYLSRPGPRAKTMIRYAVKKRKK